MYSFQSPIILLYNNLSSVSLIKATGMKQSITAITSRDAQHSSIRLHAIQSKLITSSIIELRLPYNIGNLQ